MNDPELDLIAFETGARKPAPRKAQPTTVAELVANLKAAAAAGSVEALECLAALGEA